MPQVAWAGFFCNTHVSAMLGNSDLVLIEKILSLTQLLVRDTNMFEHVLQIRKKSMISFYHILMENNDNCIVHAQF